MLFYSVRSQHVSAPTGHPHVKYEVQQYHNLGFLHPVAPVLDKINNK
jgi:hypothetical protein